MWSYRSHEHTFKTVPMCVIQGEPSTSSVEVWAKCLVIRSSDWLTLQRIFFRILCSCHHLYSWGHQQDRWDVHVKMMSTSTIQNKAQINDNLLRTGDPFPFLRGLADNVLVRLITSTNTQQKSLCCFFHPFTQTVPQIRLPQLSKATTTKWWTCGYRLTTVTSELGSRVEQEDPH